jgi:hypothetical protein
MSISLKQIAAQINYIAIHNYAGYDALISESKGSLTVYKADINHLLDMVEIAFPTDAALDGIDTDDMQVVLEEGVADTVANHITATHEVNLGPLQAAVAAGIIDKIQHRITRVKPLTAY